MVLPLSKVLFFQFQNLCPDSGIEHDN
ncbi:hypothetical protein NC651_036305 [Populus alba x Populus x berolinensis]|nr:hypothetical protein NC651_036305 [Populus alba x Populus x berolinensis]